MIKTAIYVSSLTGASLYPLDSILGGVELLVDGPLIVGCYLINSNSSSLGSFASTINDCLIQCGIGNFAAITNGLNCYCYSSFPHDFLLPSQGCTTPCPGNNNTFCGGPVAFTIAVACKNNYFFFWSFK